MKTATINWNLTALAGHDEFGNEISVRELVAAIEGLEAMSVIASLSDSTRDAIAQQAAENKRLNMRNTALQSQIASLESSLNNAHSRISSLLQSPDELHKNHALSALSDYANPKNWANPRDEHGNIIATERSVFIKTSNGYEPALKQIAKHNENAA